MNSQATFVAVQQWCMKLKLSQRNTEYSKCSTPVVVVTSPQVLWFGHVFIPFLRCNTEVDAVTIRPTQPKALSRSK